MRNRKWIGLLTGLLVLTLVLPMAALAGERAPGPPNPGIPPADPWPPESQAFADAYASGATIRVFFEAKDQGIGVALVHLWAACEMGVWHDTGLALPGGDGGTLQFFDYEPECGPGRYFFATVAEDAAGNVEELPIGDGDAQTLYDIRAPESNASSPALVRGFIIPVSFTFDDDLSGVNRVHLWVSCPLSAWQDTGLSASPTDIMVFYYRATCGSGIYHFATVAVDHAGNIESMPVGVGDTWTGLYYISPDRAKTGRVRR